MQRIGFSTVLVLLGAMRELIGQGTLFYGAELLLGEWAKSLTLHVFHVEQSFLLAILPPGAFIGLGLMIALKNAIDQKRLARQAAVLNPMDSQTKVASVNH
jgi:electron transport complex protein RnfE